MCGRYTNELEFSQLKLAFEASDATFRPWRPTYNISPSSRGGHEQLLVVRSEAGKRQLKLARFWFIPSYWKRPLSSLPTLFNARAEELPRKRTWKGAFETNRCLVPATGWREFVGDQRPKQPYHFCLDKEPFAFAALRSQWTSEEGELVESFAIITTAPSEQAARYHDRMPLILPVELYEPWLGPSRDAAPVLAEAIEQSKRRRLTIFPTDPKGNHTAVEGPEVIEPVALRADGAGATPPAREAQSPNQLSLPLGPPRGAKRS